MADRAVESEDFLNAALLHQQCANLKQQLDELTTKMAEVGSLTVIAYSPRFERNLGLCSP